MECKTPKLLTKHEWTTCHTTLPHPQARSHQIPKPTGPSTHIATLTPQQALLYSKIKTIDRAAWFQTALSFLFLAPHLGKATYNSSAVSSTTQNKKNASHTYQKDRNSQQRPLLVSINQSPWKERSWAGRTSNRPPSGHPCRYRCGVSAGADWSPRSLAPNIIT